MARCECGAPMADELEPHPVLSDVSYCPHNHPPWREAILLGFQHYLVMLGTIVIIPTALVPQMGGGNAEKGRVIQTLLFVAGLNTLLQSFFGTRLPAVIGGSYNFVLPTISIILAGRYNDIPDPHEKFLRIMRATQGALIFASTLQIILGFSGLWGKVARFLTPNSIAPLVSLVGFGPSQLGFPEVAKCFQVGLPPIFALNFLSQYIPNSINTDKKHFHYRYAVIVIVPIVWLLSYVLTVAGVYNHAAPQTQMYCRTDKAGLITTTPWIRVPYPFQWGAPTFDAGEAFAMMAASFVALIESTGCFIAVSKYSNVRKLPPCILTRGIGWQGIGILLDGLFGTANGSSVSVESVGLLGMTRVSSRRVIRISAGFMIFFSILGKIGAIFASIPTPIFAALYCILFGYVGSGGLKHLKHCDLNSPRTMYILGFSIFIGLSVPEYFQDSTSVAGRGPVNTKARWFNDIINVIFSSKTFVGATAAYALDNILNRHRHRSSPPHTPTGTGSHRSSPPTTPPGTGSNRSSPPNSSPRPLASCPCHICPSQLSMPHCPKFECDDTYPTIECIIEDYYSLPFDLCNFLPFDLRNILSSNSE